MFHVHPATTPARETSLCVENGGARTCFALAIATAWRCFRMPEILFNFRCRHVVVRVMRKIDCKRIAHLRHARHKQVRHLAAASRSHGRRPT